MAITPASFVPEKRGVQGPDNYSVGQAKNVDAAGVDPVPNTNAEQHATWENYPGAHPITNTPLPQSTGAGRGSVMKGGRGGK